MTFFLSSSLDSPSLAHAPRRCILSAVPIEWTIWIPSENRVCMVALSNIQRLPGVADILQVSVLVKHVLVQRRTEWVALQEAAEKSG
eukprot:COSAG06_NODE_37407_length_435_cov_1.217262_1_plen_87_part_10